MGGAVILDGVSDSETLEVGHDQRARLSGRARAWVVMALLAAGATAYVVDDRVRGREEVLVAACVEEASAAVETASRRLRSAYEYVRPSLGTRLAPDLEAGIVRLLADAAEGRHHGLTQARDSCARVAVWSVHDRLQERRDRCVRMLESHRSGLAAVARDGTALRDWVDLPRTC